jgi:hypothetical protein
MHNLVVGAAFGFRVTRQLSTALAESITIATDTIDSHISLNYHPNVLNEIGSRWLQP